MKSDEIEKISTKLIDILKFLEPFTGLLNCHMVNFIADRLWEELPASFTREIFSLSKEVVYEMLWQRGKSSSNFPNSEVFNFLSQCWDMSLDSEEWHDIVDSIHSIRWKLERLKKSCDSSSLICFPEFMSPKKIHEVEIFGGIVAAAAEVSNASCIVDVGGGKGYLGATLALHQNLKVLSVDSSQQHTDEAIKLSTKMAEFHKKKKKTRQEESFTNLGCKKVTAFISPQTNLSVLVEDSFPAHPFEGFSGVSSENDKEEIKKNNTICLAGLHTCGNLASFSLQLFSSQSHAVALCSIGCCYNLISEAFYEGVGRTCPEDIKEASKSMFGFPMSSLLQVKRTVLGHNARMLAAQALHRISHKKLVMPVSLFYRAVLQISLKRSLGQSANSVKVGKKMCKMKTLEEYMYASQKKLNIDLQLSEDALSDLLKCGRKYRDCMEIFYVLRIALAPIVETIILLDRLLYLYEQGVEHVFLGRLFDPIVSPRCFGIIAFKS